MVHRVQSTSSALVSQNRSLQLRTHYTESTCSRICQAVGRFFAALATCFVRIFCYSCINPARITSPARVTPQSTTQRLHTLIDDRDRLQARIDEDIQTISEDATTASRSHWESMIRAHQAQLHAMETEIATLSGRPAPVAPAPFSFREPLMRRLESDRTQMARILEQEQNRLREMMATWPTMDLDARRRTIRAMQVELHGMESQIAQLREEPAPAAPAPYELPQPAAANNPPAPAIASEAELENRIRQLARRWNADENFIALLPNPRPLWQTQMRIHQTELHNTATQLRALRRLPPQAAPTPYELPAFVDSSNASRIIPLPRRATAPANTPPNPVPIALNPEAVRAAAGLSLGITAFQGAPPANHSNQSAAWAQIQTINVNDLLVEYDRLVPRRNATQRNTVQTGIAWALGNNGRAQGYSENIRFLFKSLIYLARRPEIDANAKLAAILSACESDGCESRRYYQVDLQVTNLQEALGRALPTNPFMEQEDLTSYLKRQHTNDKEERLQRRFQNVEGSGDESRQDYALVHILNRARRDSGLAWGLRRDPTFLSDPYIGFSGIYQRPQFEHILCEDYTPALMIQLDQERLSTVAGKRRYQEELARIMREHPEALPEGWDNQENNPLYTDTRGTPSFAGIAFVLKHNGFLEPTQPVLGL